MDSGGCNLERSVHDRVGRCQTACPRSLHCKAVLPQHDAAAPLSPHHLKPKRLNAHLRPDRHARARQPNAREYRGSRAIGDVLCA